MLVKFETRVSASITMFGDVAIRLLKLMGRRPTIPSAILPEDIPEALQRLKKGIAAEEAAAIDQQGAELPDEEEQLIGRRLDLGGELRDAIPELVDLGSPGPELATPRHCRLVAVFEGDASPGIRNWRQRVGSAHGFDHRWCLQRLQNLL